MVGTRREFLTGLGGVTALGSVGRLASAAGQTDEDLAFERIVDRDRGVRFDAAARRGNRVFAAGTLYDPDKRDDGQPGDLLLAAVDLATGTVRTATHATIPVDVRAGVATSDRLLIFCSAPDDAGADLVYAFRGIGERVDKWKIPHPGPARTLRIDAWTLRDRVVHVSAHRGVSAIGTNVAVRDLDGRPVAQAKHHERLYDSAFVDDGTPYLIDGEALWRVGVESATLERVQSIGADYFVPTDGGFLGVANADRGFDVRPYDGSRSPAGEWRSLATGLDHRTVSLEDAAWTGDAVLLALTASDDDGSSRTWLGAVEDGHHQPWSRTFADGWTGTALLPLDRGYLLAGRYWTNGWLLRATGRPDHSAGLGTPTAAAEPTATVTATRTSETAATGDGPLWTTGGAVAATGLLYGVGKRLVGDDDRREPSTHSRTAPSD